MAKIDFMFSEDGDIILGPPKLDKSANLLYFHTDNTIDTNRYQGNEEGKLICDFTYSTGREAWKQTIINRLKTEAPDWYHYPTMGGNLTDLIGEPNTRETGDLGVRLITEALTYSNLFSAADLNVRPVPISAEEIMFLITVQTVNNEPYQLPIVFNLNYGLKEV